MAKIIELEQRSSDWHSFRLQHIGGSDASLIGAYWLGLDWPFGDSWPGADIYKLFLLKTGQIVGKQATGSAIAHGNKTEPEAREWYSMETGEFAPPVVLEHETLPYLGTSLDGFTGEKILELKCPVEPTDHIKAREGQIPEKYMCQVQHSLFVAGVEHGDYVSYFEGKGVIVPIEVDQEFLTKLRVYEDVFWEWVKKKEFPLPNGGAIKCDEEAWQKLIFNYFEAQKVERQMEAEMKRLKSEMMRFMEFKQASQIIGGGGNVKVSVRGPRTVKSFTTDPGLDLAVRHEGKTE